MKFKTTDADKKKWGPYCWYLLHLIAYKSQEEDIDRLVKLFSKLHKVIPCPKCKDHYKEWIAKNPLTIESNKRLIMPPRQLSKKPNLVQWTIGCHNNVNVMSHKNILSDSQVYDLFWIKAQDGNDILPVNHVYIMKLLQILGNYHEEMGTLDIFNDFLYDLRKIFPCEQCRKELKRNKNCDMETYLDIIGRCQSQDGIQDQKYKV